MRNLFTFLIGLFTPTYVLSITETAGFNWNVLIEGSVLGIISIITGTAVAILTAYIRKKCDF